MLGDHVLFSQLIKDLQNFDSAIRRLVQESLHQKLYKFDLSLSTDPRSVVIVARNTQHFGDDITQDLAESLSQLVSLTIVKPNEALYVHVDCLWC